MEIYPDSFLFQADQDSLEYSEFAPQPLCQGDLEVWLAQIRYSYHRIALEIDNHPEESIHDICRLFPCQKLHKTSGTSDDDVAKLRGDQAWLSLRYCVGANDQVNRAEATASTEAQNADAASVVPTPSPATTAAPVQRIVRRFCDWFPLSYLIMSMGLWSEESRVIQGRLQTLWEDYPILFGCQMLAAFLLTATLLNRHQHKSCN
jgi:hypothetical protein